MMENKIKHLEMIQNIIARMASNSFIIKGWSVTGIGAIYAYWISNQNHRVLFLILFATILFWFHDAYYLQLERGFRNFYEEVRMKDESEIDFKMKVSNLEDLFYIALTRPILRNTYGSITIITLILLCIFK